MQTKTRTRTVEKQEFYMELPNGVTIAAKTEKKLKEKYKKWCDENIVMPQKMSLELEFPIVRTGEELYNYMKSIDSYSQHGYEDSYDNCEIYRKNLGYFFGQEISVEELPFPLVDDYDDKSAFIFWVGKKKPKSVERYIANMEEHVKIYEETLEKLAESIEDFDFDAYVKDHKIALLDFEMYRHS
jgi:hypothetical protein